LPLVARLNVVSDVAWEREIPALFAEFPAVQFMDYTKDITRVLDSGRPPNYHLTFSRSEANEADCRRALASGHNVTAVFRRPPFPATLWSYPVIDGDRDDLRFLDPSPCIVGLKAKGAGGRRDASGFVLEGKSGTASGRIASTTNRERILTMTIYNVHIYRQMRLVFKGIEADSHEAAAASVRDKQTDRYDDIADCDGETYYACIDVQGDDGYEQSRWIDFEPERERQAAGKLLESSLSATAYILHVKGRAPELHRQADGSPSIEQAVNSAIAAAQSAGILPEPAPAIARFDTFEIEPRIRHWEDGDPEKPDHSACEEHEADMWRLYGTRHGQDSVCIDEYATRAISEDVYAGITGRRYTRPS
jgi:hypothetical protein